MQSDTDVFQKSGIQIVGISYDDVSVLKKFADSKKITFPLLSDDGSKAIKAYGLHFQRGLPHPGTLLIDQQGKIRARIFEQGYRKRHTIEALLEAAKQLAQPPTKSLK